MDIKDIVPPEVTPFVIFFAKNLEISFSSMRIISINRGYRLLAIIMAAFESLVWILSLSLIVTNLNNIYNILAFVLAMSTGSYLGIYIEKKLALGNVVVQLITQKSSKILLEKLRKVGFRVTAIDGESNYGKVQVLFAAVKRKSLSGFISLVRDFNPNAFFTIEDLRETSQVVKKVSKEMTQALLEKQEEKQTVFFAEERARMKQKNREKKRAKTRKSTKIEELGKIKKPKKIEGATRKKSPKTKPLPKKTK